MKALLTIYGYRILNLDMVVLFNKLNNNSKSTFKRLPKFCITDNKTIRYTDEYHQYTILEDSVNLKYFYLFDYDTTNNHLKEIISNEGFDDFIKPFSKKLFNIFIHNELNDIDTIIPDNIDLVIDIDYKCEDIELFMNGYLDNDLKLISNIK